jgi:enoyl-CoA hydratase
MADFETLLLEPAAGGIAVLTVNRPDKLNALNATVMRELHAAVDRIEGDATVRGVIVTGSGAKAFVAGADIAELSVLDSQTGTEFSRRGQAIFSRIESSSKPFLALVNGFALGGGCELAMACHLRVATSNAVFGLPETSLGTIPGFGGTQRLTQLVGKGRALELMLTGKPIKADQALAWGLANRVTEPDAAMETARDLLGTILGRGPLAVASVIQAVLAGQEGAETGYQAEAEQFGDLCDSDDFKEGTQAFLAKRPPTFTGH